jgi:hypothetical protein
MVNMVLDSCNSFISMVKLKIIDKKLFHNSDSSLTKEVGVKMNKIISISFLLTLILLSSLLSGCANKNDDITLLKSLEKSNIDHVEISSLAIRQHKKITNAEVKTLINLLTTSGSIKIYAGPIPKGGSLEFTIFMKTGSIMSLFRSSDGFLLFSKNKAYDVQQSGFKEFTKIIYDKYKIIDQ